MTQFISTLLSALLTVAIFSFPVLWLWNWVMPITFGLPVIDFWTASGLLMLSNLLFKNNTSTKHDNN